VRIGLGKDLFCVLLMYMNYNTQLCLAMLFKDSGGGGPPGVLVLIPLTP
jgi:hypothetical protein